MYLSQLVYFTAFVTFSIIESLSHTKGQISMTSNRNIQKPTWGFLKNRGVPSPTILDLVSVLGRFEEREDFYTGVGYQRPKPGGLLTNITFYDNINQRKFTNWPVDEYGVLLGTEGMNENEIADMRKKISSEPASVRGCEAIFTSFAKGATNGVAYPRQVDEEMLKWRSPDRVIDVESLESSLMNGKFYVFIGWFLYIGLQFGGVYIVFFVPFMKQFFPDYDFYFVQTALHTETWFK